MKRSAKTAPKHASRADATKDRGEKATYQSPRLTVLGDVRDLTMGGSPGVGDTGDPFNTQPVT